MAEELPDRIARTIFLDALVLNQNESVFEMLPAAFLDSLKPKNNGRQRAPSPADPAEFDRPPWETWRDNFMQDAQQSHARSVWEHLTPEPSQVNLDKLDLKRFYLLPIPKSFIYCRQDKAMPPGYFHPGMSSRLGACKLLEMDGGHEIMFTRPVELSEKLVDASSD